MILNHFYSPPRQDTRSFNITLGSMFMDFDDEFGYIISHNVFLNVGSFSNLSESSD